MGLDRARLGEHLATLDAFASDATQQAADVVASLALVEQLLEHLDAGDGRLLGLVLEADDLDFVAHLHLAALDTAGGHGATAFDRKHVFDGHQERLVELANGLGDVGINGVEQIGDALVRLRIGRAVVGRLAGATNDRHVVAGEAILRKQLADFHLDKVEKLRIVHEVDLVEEDHERGHADLLGQQDVLAGLGHRAVGGAHHQDRAVHLGGAGDHVLDEVGVARAIDVGVVPLVGLVFHVADRDRHGLRFVADGAALGDVGVALGNGQVLRRLNGDQRTGEGRLAMIDVTDGAHIDVRLAPRERILCHLYSCFLLGR